MSEFPLEQVIEMQREFAVLYHTTGLLDMADSYIQVNHECLTELSDPADWALSPGHDAEEIEALIFISGSKFIALMDPDEAEALGLTLPS